MELRHTSKLNDQLSAFGLLYSGITRSSSPPAMLEHGAENDSTTGVAWKWEKISKRGNSTVFLWKNTFRLGEETVTFTIPLNCVDINDQGIIGVDAFDCMYLCRQGLTSHPAEARLDDEFKSGWVGPVYSKFIVKTRVYHACVPLSRGADTISEELKLLLMAIEKTKHRKLRTRAESKALMSKYFNNNRHTLPANISKMRDTILDDLMNGGDVREAFMKAVEEIARRTNH